MSLSVVGWRVYYEGKRMFTSAETTWDDLPDDGVLLVITYYDEFGGGGEVRRRGTISGHDWYFHRPGTDLFGGNSDPIEENRERYPDCIFKRGKWAEASEMRWARERSQEDPLPVW